MIKKSLLFFFLIFANLTFSQKQTNFWYFGIFGGLDFNSGSPVVLSNSAMNTTEGCSTISDASGNLLFYTDGVSVWNKNHIQMPNGFGLKGDISTSQCLIVPAPGNSNQYFIFTIDDEGGPDGLTYSTVDMSLQSGDGDVTTKNVLLQNTMTEKLAAVYHCNNHDIWLMAHSWLTNTYSAYLITDTGVSATPVSSNVGTIHNDVHGQMKFNSLGTKIASAIGSQDTVDLLDFNKVSGVVSNPLSLSCPLNNKVYGVEFSPDNSKLYVTHYEIGNSGSVVQFDLSATNIQASRFTLGTSFDPNYLYSLQLAPDNKIYVAKEVSPFLCSIDNPNVAGTGASYVDNAINVDPLGNGNTVMLGLPGFVQSFFNPLFPSVPCTTPLTVNFSSNDTTICMGQCINFTDLTTGSPNSWTWTFTGSSSASSIQQNPTNICYPSAGTYPVKLVASDGTSTDTATFNIIVVSPPVIDAGPNSTILPGASVQLNATGTASAYSWTPSSGLSSTNIANPVASPSGTTTYIVTGTDVNGCSSMDSVTISIDSPCGEVFVPNAFSPNKDGQNDFECVLGDCILSMHFMIYDRWGEKVFDSINKTDCWDGIYKGKVMNTATFVYYLEATLQTGEVIKRKGNISLIR